MPDIGSASHVTVDVETKQTGWVALQMRCLSSYLRLKNFISEIIGPAFPLLGPFAAAAAFFVSKITSFLPPASKSISICEYLKFELFLIYFLTKTLKSGILIKKKIIKNANLLRLKILLMQYFETINDRLHFLSPHEELLESLETIHHLIATGIIGAVSVEAFY